MSPRVRQPVLVGDRRGLLGVVVVLEGPAAGEVDDADLTGRQLVAVLADDVALVGRPPDRAGVLEPLLRR